MTEEAQELREAFKRNQIKQRFLNSILVIGIVAIFFAFGIYFRSTENAVEQNSLAIREVQNSLKVTCDIAKDDSSITLPRSVREDCLLAEQNKIPEKISDPDDPENQDPENQDPELQDGETQDPETQDPENQDIDPNDPDPFDDPDLTDDPENDDPDPDDPEIQDPEIQEGEIQEPEEQNYPICEPGYTRQDFVYYGPDALPNTGDEQTWRLCVRD
jgi:hypothetical protein